MVSLGNMKIQKTQVFAFLIKTIWCVFLEEFCFIIEFDNFLNHQNNWFFFWRVHIEQRKKTGCRERRQPKSNTLRTTSSQAEALFVPTRNASLTFQTKVKKELLANFPRTAVKLRSILAAISWIDEFLLSSKNRIPYRNVPEISRERSTEKQKPNQDRSQKDPHFKLEDRCFRTPRTVILEPDGVLHTLTGNQLGIPLALL